MNSEISDHAKWARANGWTVEDRASDNYTEFRNTVGELIYLYPATPGRSNRRIAELRVALRAAGLAWPPLSKKEQRAQRRKVENKEEPDD